MPLTPGKKRASNDPLLKNKLASIWNISDFLPVSNYILVVLPENFAEIISEDKASKSKGKLTRSFNSKRGRDLLSQAKCVVYSAKIHANLKLPEGVAANRCLVIGPFPDSCDMNWFIQSYQKLLSKQLSHDERQAIHDDLSSVDISFCSRSKKKKSYDFDSLWNKSIFEYIETNTTLSLFITFPPDFYTYLNLPEKSTDKSKIYQELRHILKRLGLTELSISRERLTCEMKIEPFFGSNGKAVIDDLVAYIQNRTIRNDETVKKRILDNYIAMYINTSQPAMLIQPNEEAVALPIQFQPDTESHNYPDPLIPVYLEPELTPTIPSHTGFFKPANESVDSITIQLTRDYPYNRIAIDISRINQPDLFVDAVTRVLMTESAKAPFCANPFYDLSKSSNKHELVLSNLPWSSIYIIWETIIRNITLLQKTNYTFVDCDGNVYSKIDIALNKNGTFTVTYSSIPNAYTCNTQSFSEAVTFATNTLNIQSSTVQIDNFNFSP